KDANSRLIRRESCRAERYSAANRVFSCLRVCPAIQSARQVFSKPLNVASGEIFFAFLTRSSLSITVVLILFSSGIPSSHKCHTICGLYQALPVSLPLWFDT